MKATKGTAWLAGMLLLAALVVPVRGATRAETGQTGAASAGAKYVHFEITGVLQESLPPVYLLEPDQTLHTLLLRVEKAGSDPNVQGLIVRVGPFVAGWAKVQEVRDALIRCGAAGKDTICMLEYPGNRAYYLATGAQRIVMAPSGHLMLSGLRAEALFAKELLDKIGIQADFAQAGKYKGAAESLTRKEPSPALRTSLESMLDSYYEQMLDAVAKGRGVPVSRAATLVRQGPYTARGAKEAGLVDDVMFYDQVLTELRERHDNKLLVEKDYARQPRARSLQMGGASLFSLLMGAPSARRSAPRGPAIAVLYAVGPILPEEPGFGLGEQVVAADTFVKAVRQAAADSNVKAIVLRVDSPGGSALACDTIWRELRLADQKKPVIASFSDTAASGGYYVGVAARRIYAQPGTLTGSIGVVGGKLVLRQLLEKIGVNVVIFERGRGGGFLSAFEEFSARDRKKLEELLQDTYRTFLQRVAETRTELSGRKLERVAEGRIWTGQQAHANGLVDEIGGLREAILAAKEAAGIPAGQRVRLLHLPRSRSLVELALFGPGDEVRMPSLWDVTRLPPSLAEIRPYLTALVSLRNDVSLCLMPAAVIIR